MESVVFIWYSGGHSIRITFYDAPKNLKRLFIRNNSIKTNTKE